MLSHLVMLQFIFFTSTIIETALNRLQRACGVRRAAPHFQVKGPSCEDGDISNVPKAS